MANINGKILLTLLSGAIDQLDALKEALDEQKGRKFTRTALSRTLSEVVESPSLTIYSIVHYYQHTDLNGYPQVKIQEAASKLTHEAATNHVNKLLEGRPNKILYMVEDGDGIIEEEYELYSIVPIQVTNE